MVIRYAIRSILFSGMMLLVFTLTLALVFLYTKSREVQKENHSLLIQNDSVMSVNIELNKQLQKK